jgi:hypothetical protein
MPQPRRDDKAALSIELNGGEATCELKDFSQIGFVRPD